MEERGEKMAEGREKWEVRRGRKMEGESTCSCRESMVVGEDDKGQESPRPIVRASQATSLLA